MVRQLPAIETESTTQPTRTQISLKNGILLLVQESSEDIAYEISELDDQAGRAQRLVRDIQDMKQKVLEACRYAFFPDYLDIYPLAPPETKRNEAHYAAPRRARIDATDTDFILQSHDRLLVEHYKKVKGLLEVLDQIE